MEVIIRKLEAHEYKTMREMAVQRWNTEHGSWEYYDIFDLDFIDFCMGGIYEDESMMLGAYIKNELVGTAGLSVFNAVIQGKEYKVAYGSWLTSDLMKRKKLMRGEKNKKFYWENSSENNDSRVIAHSSLAYLLVSAIYSYCGDHDIKGIFAYFENRSVSHTIVNQNTEASGLAKKNFQIKKTYSLAKIVNMKKLFEKSDIPFYLKLGARAIGLDKIPEYRGDFSDFVIPYSDKYLSECVSLLNELKEQVPVARIWTEEELKRQLAFKNLSKTLLLVNSGKVKGLINFVILDSVGNLGTLKYALLDHIHISHLNKAQKKYFITEFLKIIRGKGLTGAIFRHMNYFDESILSEMKFRKNRRKLSQIFISLDSNIRLEGVNGTYVSFL